MYVFIVSFRVVEYGIYKMIIVANDYDEAENLARANEPDYEIGSVERIYLPDYKFPKIVRTLKYIE